MYNKEIQQITAPVTINDVQRALGLGANNLQALCTSDRINMLSKSKPVAHADFRAPEWWKGAGNCGINIPATVDDLNKHFAPQQWAYQKPTTMFWLSDFSGYRHSAAYIADFGGLNITPLSPIKLCVSNRVINNMITGSVIAIENSINGLLGLRDILNMPQNIMIFIEVVAINNSFNPTRSSRILLSNRNANIYDFRLDAPQGCDRTEDIRIALVFGYITTTGAAVYLSPNCPNSNAVDSCRCIEQEGDLGVDRKVTINVIAQSYTVTSMTLNRFRFPYTNFFIRILHRDDKGVICDKEFNYSGNSDVIPLDFSAKGIFTSGDLAEIERSFKVGFEVYTINNYGRRVLAYADRLDD